jgi:acetyl esterase/lipase
VTNSNNSLDLKSINLWEGQAPGYNAQYSEEQPSITPYVIEDGKVHSALIVFPGGGYCMRADHEGEPLALWLNSLGISAFVLNYRVAPYKYPYPIMDAQRAIRLVRHRAQEWKIDGEKIGILGFSAGGHLASSAGTHYDYGNKTSEDVVERMSSRPDAMVLCYPVITFGEYRHDGSMVALLGHKPDEELRNSFSNENSVTEDTPCTFLWHTSDDGAVPVENSLMFASALRKSKVPFELHVFPKGPHGLGMAEGIPQVDQWVRLCESWLKSINFAS